MWDRAGRRVGGRRIKEMDRKVEREMGPSADETVVRERRKSANPRGCVGREEACDVQDAGASDLLRAGDMSACSVALRPILRRLTQLL